MGNIFAGQGREVREDDTSCTPHGRICVHTAIYFALRLAMYLVPHVRICVGKRWFVHSKKPFTSQALLCVAKYRHKLDPLTVIFEFPFLHGERQFIHRFL